MVVDCVLCNHLVRQHRFYIMHYYAIAINGTALKDKSISVSISDFESCYFLNCYTTIYFDSDLVKDLERTFS